jgi:hypothetical protein
MSSDLSSDLHLKLLATACCIGWLFKIAALRFVPVFDRVHLMA